MKAALCAGLAIVLCGFAPDEDFDKACAKAAEMSKYGFKLASKIEGMGGGGGGGGGGGQPVECKVDKDVATEVKSGQTTAYKKGDVLVYKDGEEWKKYERPKGGGGGGGQDRTARAMGLLAGLKVPHELLADFGKKLKEAKKADEKENDCAVYSGDLTDEAAKELGSLGGRRAGGGGGGGGDFTYSGNAKVWVNGDGAIVKFEIHTESKGKIRDRDVNIKATRTYEISDVGNVKLEVPEGAMKVLGGP